jgi:hypothetical protein
MIESLACTEDEKRRQGHPDRRGRLFSSVRYSQSSWPRS